MTLAENLADLEMHARHFRERHGFTYTVLERATGTVVGCVYIYPVGAADADRSSDLIGHDASIRSWVSAAYAPHEAWPFERVAYAPRP